MIPVMINFAVATIYAYFKMGGQERKVREAENRAEATTSWRQPQ